MVVARSPCVTFLLAVAMACQASLVRGDWIALSVAAAEFGRPYDLGTQTDRPRIIIPGVGHWSPGDPDAPPDDPGDTPDPPDPGGIPRSTLVFNSTELAGSLGVQTPFSPGTSGAPESWAIVASNGPFPIRGDLIQTPEPSTLLLVLIATSLLITARRRQQSPSIGGG